MHSRQASINGQPAAMRTVTSNLKQQMNDRKQPSKKSIREEAKELLKQGKSRQEIYEQLTEKFKYRKIVADVLKNLPSKKAKDKYQKWNFILLGLLILTAVIYFLATPTIGIVLWYGLMIYAVARMLTRYYLWVTILTALGLIGGAVAIFAGDSHSINWINIVVLLVLNIPLIVLPIWLTNKLTPNPVEKKERYQGKDGRQKMRLTYEFPEK